MSAGCERRRPLNASFDDDPAGYDRRRECWLNRRRASVVLDRLAARPVRAVLEVGAGTGTLLTRLAVARPDLRFTGVEPLDGYVRFARRRAARLGLRNLEFHVGTAEQLPTEVAGQVFSYVLSNDTLHHVDDVAAGAQAVARVTAPGAGWLAIEPNRLNPYVLGYHALTAGERNFAPRAFLAAASAAGWRLERRTYLFVVPTAVKSVPAWVARAELVLERVPVLAGGLALELCRSA